MKKIIITFCIAILPFTIHAQLGRLLNKAKNKTGQRIDNKIDDAIDKTLDGLDGHGNSGSSKKDSVVPVKPAVTPVVNETAPVKQEENIKSFTKYDFIPGEKVLYAEDLSQEAIGELPVGWNTNGSGETVTLSGLPGNWLRLHNPFIYLSSNTKELSENFTVEFDMILQLKNNGWMYPTFSAGLFSANGKPGTDNSFLKEYEKYASVTATIYPEENGNSRVLVESSSEGQKYFKSEAKTYSELDKSYGKPVHVSIQAQKQRFRIWIDETKLFDIPKAIDTAYKMNQLLFKIGATNYKEEQYAIYVANIKMAVGLPDTRHKLIEEGKFSTTGILFDVNSATIKPVSYGVVKEIATVLKENPSIKIKIIGHTSSDGDDNVNMELSKKRAVAVKEMLVTSFGIDGTLLETEGKGETQPVADNKTKEGKEANRRVEFIKL